MDVLRSMNRAHHSSSRVKAFVSTVIRFVSGISSSSFGLCGSLQGTADRVMLFHDALEAFSRAGGIRALLFVRHDAGGVDANEIRPAGSAFGMYPGVGPDGRFVIGEDAREFHLANPPEQSADQREQQPAGLALPALSRQRDSDRAGEMSLGGADAQCAFPAKAQSGDEGFHLRLPSMPACAS